MRAGEDALVEVGITDMHPELINLLGRLRYRTSYGQNVLKPPHRVRPYRRDDGQRAAASTRC